MLFRCAALALSAGLAATTAADVTLRLVALTGDPAPGLPGVTFKTLADPRLSPSGNFSFTAFLAGSGVTGANDGSVWTGRIGAYALNRREGDDAGFAIDLVLAAVPAAAMNDRGELCFSAALLDRSFPNRVTGLALYIEDGSGTYAIARDGSDGILYLPTRAPYNDVHTTAIAIDGGAAIRSNRAGSLTTLWRRGDGAPGIHGPEVFGLFNQPTQNAAGHVLFRASITAPDNNVPLAHGLWLDDGQPTLVALTTRQAPDLPTGFDFDRLSPDARLANDRTVTFWGGLSAFGTPRSGEGLWTGPAGAPTLVAWTGDQPPGIPDARFAWFSTDPDVSPAGQIAFLAGHRGSSVGTGVWFGRRGSLRLVARDGDAVPRLPRGTRIERILSQPRIIGDNQLAFLVRLAGEGVGADSNIALLATDRAGAVHPIARLGDRIDVRGNGSDLRTVREIVIGSGHGIEGRSITDGNGAAVIWLSLADAQKEHSAGLFLASVGCPADMDGNGRLDIRDFFAFQSAYAAGDLRRADFSGDGVLDIRDFFAFQAAYAAGCP